MNETNVLDHGLIAMTDHWGHDLKPAEIARTSYRNEKERTLEENEKLINYLMKNRHDTPFEFCGAMFYVVMPIFVARQWVRHRAASINEESLRYVEARRDVYIPEPERCQKQSQSNKQGSAVECVYDAALVRRLMQTNAVETLGCYDELIKQGLARELARSVLPLGLYTAWYWQANLRMILHFLSLRTDPHAQYEIRVYADAMLDQVRHVFPTVVKAWEEAR